MTDQHLKTSGTHRFIQSPLGALFETGIFERIKSQGLYMEVASARVGAAALAARGDVRDFLLYLGGNLQLDSQLRDRIYQFLVRYEHIKRQHDTLVQTT